MKTKNFYLAGRGDLWSPVCLECAQKPLKRVILSVVELLVKELADLSKKHEPCEWDLLQLFADFRPISYFLYLKRA